MGDANTKFPQSISLVFAAHPAIQAVAAIAVSALWYLSCVQDLRRGRNATGASWVIIALAILLAATIGFAVNRELVGASIDSAALAGGTAIALKYGFSQNSKSSTDQRDS